MSVYEGEWVNGKREGDGRQVFADGDGMRANGTRICPTVVALMESSIRRISRHVQRRKPDGSGKLVETSARNPGRGATARS